MRASSVIAFDHCIFPTVALDALEVDELSIAIIIHAIRSFTSLAGRPLVFRVHTGVEDVLVGLRREVGSQSMPPNWCENARIAFLQEQAVRLATDANQHTHRVTALTNGALPNGCVEPAL